MSELFAVYLRRLLVGALVLGTTVISGQSVNAQQLSTTDVQPEEAYVRAQVLEPFDVIEIIKDAVEVSGAAEAAAADDYVRGTIAPADLSGLGLTPDILETSISGRYFTRVEVVNGTITVTYDQPDTHENIKGRTMTFTPYQTRDGAIAWRCGNAAAPAGAVLMGTLAPVRVAAYVAPTISDSYLPEECRANFRR